MTTNIYWNDQVGSIFNATLTHKSGHILLRDIPVEKRPEIEEACAAWRNEVADVNNTGEEPAIEFLEANGFVRAENFNPPLVAFTYAPEGLAGATDEDADANPDGNELKDMKVAELRTLAGTLGIEDPDKKSKAELLPLVSAAMDAKKGEDGQK